MITQNVVTTDFNALIDTLSIQGYVIIDDFLATNIILALHDEAHRRHANNEMSPAKTGLANQSQQTVIRGDLIAWLDESSENLNIQTYFKQMHALKTVLNQQLFMNLQSIETHLAVYPIGNIYRKHLDQFSQNLDNKIDTKARKLSSVLYLNAGWQALDGGELRLHLDEFEYLDILPTSGKLVLFLSSRFWHEVLPAQRERASLTGWFRTRGQLLI